MDGTIENQHELVRNLDMLEIPEEEPTELRFESLRDGIFMEASAVSPDGMTTISVTEKMTYPFVDTELARVSYKIVSMVRSMVDSYDEVLRDEA